MENQGLLMIACLILFFVLSGEDIEKVFRKVRKRLRLKGKTKTEENNEEVKRES